jgi:hypothetical protein
MPEYRAVIIDAARAADPAVPIDAVRAAVDAVLTSRAVARELAAALGEDPAGAFAAGAPPTVARLITAAATRLDAAAAGLRALPPRRVPPDPHRGRGCLQPLPSTAARHRLLPLRRGQTHRQPRRRGQAVLRPLR